MYCSLEKFNLPYEEALGYTKDSHKSKLLTSCFRPISWHILSQNILLPHILSSEESLIYSFPSFISMKKVHKLTSFLELFALDEVGEINLVDIKSGL